jgi:RNA polymerase sigma-70 factor (ECF subfamily)
MMTPLPTTDDAELLRRLRQGDGAAFQQLYRRHQAALYRFALLHSGAPGTAADVVQEVFIGLLDDRFRFDPLRGALAGFLFGVARKLVLRHEEALGRMAALPGADSEDNEPAWEGMASESDQPLERLLLQEEAENLRQALARLAPHFRDVVILYELHDLSYQEIAQICQIDIGTVRSRLSRGRAALAKRLGAGAFGSAAPAARADAVKSREAV